MTVQSGGRDRSCCRHGPHYVGSSPGGHPDPHVSARLIVHIVVGAALTAIPDLPRFELGRIFTEATLAPVPLVVTVWAAGLYLVGVAALRRRGDHWPVGRTLAFVPVGMGLFWVATSSGLAAYDTTLLSVHMVQHMVLSMLVPLALALGAPVTLALRTLPPRPRRWLLVVLHSRVAKVLSFAPLTFLLYVVSPWALYFTSWYDASLHSSYVHEAMHLHLVLVGTLFFWPLMGVDPVPGRVSHPFRVLLVVLTLPFHAFLGVTIMGQDELIGGDWYPALHDGPMGAWLPDPIDDQHLAGGILWGSGDLVGLVFFAVLFAQWVRSSMREATREDRRLDLLEARGPAKPGDGTGTSPDR
jgi:cytochrome c oxidase assembly factor CtaG